MSKLISCDDARNIHCVSIKKQNTSVLIITLTNDDRFPKFFHSQIPEEILYTEIMKSLYFTLRMFLHYIVKLEKHQLLQISMAYCTCDLRIRLARYKARSE